MPSSFEQKDVDAPGGTTTVRADATSLLFVERLHVNTDGTRRSYSVDDFWGETTALNNLCNAMSDACAGLNADGLKARRIVTQRAYAAGWPAADLVKTKIAKSIIPFKGGKPCPAVDGFLVSATALARPNASDPCDLSNYVDALTVPAIVLPKAPSGFADKGARVGDLAVVAVPGDSRVVYAVVGDSGPRDKLGEASIALNGQLLGKTQPPANYREVRGKSPYQGKGWAVPKAVVLVFPGTRDGANPYMTTDRVDAAAKERFEAWGGPARLAACAAAN
jgi:hypothetical protein